MLQKKIEMLEAYSNLTSLLSRNGVKKTFVVIYLVSRASGS